MVQVGMVLELHSKVRVYSLVGYSSKIDDPGQNADLAIG